MCVSRMEEGVVAKDIAVAKIVVACFVREYLDYVVCRSCKLRSRAVRYILVDEC